ncbi:MAG: glycosyltransferase family 2 protein [Calditrichia bacterium]
MENAIFISLYFLTLFVLALFGLHKYFLLYTYRKYKRQSIPPPPEPEEWPRVTVQLPVYNELYVLRRLLKAVVNLDYPADKIHFQLLDDSTDGTSRLAQKFVKVLRRKGYPIDYIHRDKRQGFKAGALANGLAKTSAEYLAVFDADFVPPRDFLRKTIPYLMQPGVGMVQARWGHLNRDYSLLTRLQSIFLDAHFLIEHFARDRSGRFFNFNGTAGVWRRQAILDAGGWQHDTLTEDLDLSYRAQLAGWKFIFLPEVIAPAELPTNINAYKNQQHRWAKGSVQTARKLLRKIWKAKLPLYVRLEAIIHLSNNLAYLLMIIPSILIIPVLKYQLETKMWWPILVYFFVFFSATVSVVVYYIYAIKESQGKIWPHILYLPALISLGIGLSINNGRAAIEALLGHESEFNRTPKFRIEGKRRYTQPKFYQTAKNYFFLFELVFALYFTLGMIYFISEGYFLSMPFFFLFQFGFFYLALTSWLSQRQAR